MYQSEITRVTIFLEQCLDFLCNFMVHWIYIYMKLAELPGFARDSRSIIIHVFVPVFPQFNVWPLTPLLNAPRSLKGLICLASYIHSHADGSPYMCQIWSQSVQLFGIFPTFLNLWPSDPLQMPLGARGLIVLAYIHSLVNLYTCAKFGHDHSSGLEAFPDLWVDDPLTPHAPRVSRG